MKNWELKQRQSLPLKAKIQLTEQKIKEFYQYFNGEIYISFSGGKDSTVLLDIARNLYSDIPGVFINTGLEYPEIVKFVKTFDNIEILHPKISFKKVLETHGYPIISKIVARQLRTIKNPTAKNSATVKLYKTGIKQDGTQSLYFKLPNKWKYLINENIKISEKCCDIMKKNPFTKYEQRTKKQGCNGTMAVDSSNRLFSYLKTGCNSFNQSHGSSKPLGFWTTDDIWEYINTKNIPYCSIYDTGVKTTGCIFCMFGVHLEKEPNRFQRMSKTHPKLYKYCIEKLELYKPLNLLKVNY